MGGRKKGKGEGENFKSTGGQLLAKLWAKLAKSSHQSRDAVRRGRTEFRPPFGRTFGGGAGGGGRRTDELEWNTERNWNLIGSN